MAGVSCNGPGVCCGQRLPKLRGDVRRSERAADIDGRAPELRGRGRDLCQTYAGCHVAGELVPARTPLPRWWLGHRRQAAGGDSSVCRELLGCAIRAVPVLAASAQSDTADPVLRGAGHPLGRNRVGALSW